ncbi:MAG: GAF domain-containing protein [Anaerolineales bacterium]|uniref:GAF domain-containing protein n=1 Tax=Candidatus Desulfolinea nitratireducens TaxID=2841698 RepID=A0A8J6TFK7_9CHLR|nr:GAF domain-containing protein [Candidatus Desulfolinea nitratireducens]MBL6959760.1 GAF domain-containing protein [Anaerolineales bacterium]
MNWWRNRSIRFKASSIIILILLPLLGGIIYAVTTYAQGELWKREILAAENLNSIASSLVSDAMMEGHKHDIQTTLEKLGENIGGQFDSIAIYDDQYVLTSYATGFPGGRNLDRGIYEVGASDPTCWGCHQLPPEERPVMSIVSIEGQDVLRSVVPLYNEPRCQTCHGTGLEVLGDSIVDLSLSNFQETSQTVTLGLGVSLLSAIGLLFLIMYQFLRRVILTPLEELGEVSQIMAQGELDRQVHVRSDDEIGQLGMAFNSMAAQVSSFVHTLEERVAERTLSLEERSKYLQTSAEISRAVASITDADALIREVVKLIQIRFNFYYVGLFLTDPANEWAVLQAGTGQAGQTMLDRNHRLKVGDGMIGWSIANAQPRFALDVGEDAVRFENPLLPETRSEGALPLRSRGRVLGALTIQSSQPAAFNRDIIAVLQTMADQIAVALNNADLFAKSEIALEAERKAYGDLSQKAWIELSRRQIIPRFLSDESNIVHSIKEIQSPETLQALKTGQMIQHDGLTAILPVKNRGKVIGGIKLRKPKESGAWTKEQLFLAETLAEQIGIALEGARLFDQAQQRAVQERTIGEISLKIGATTNIDAIMRSTVQELGRHLTGTEIILELESDQD